jgi:hypothetical protein
VKIWEILSDIKVIKVESDLDLEQRKAHHKDINTDGIQLGLKTFIFPGCGSFTQLGNFSELLLFSISIRYVTFKDIFVHFPLKPKL